MDQKCFPFGTRYRLMPTKDGGYRLEVLAPGKAPYTVFIIAENEKEKALAWIVAAQEKTIAAKRQQIMGRLRNR